MPPAVEALLAWRGATRLAAYGEQLLTNALIGDRIYGSFDSLGAATGRMSCRTPNLQQMHRGRHYRETIAAPPGETLVKVDYNALQMRIAADISGDQNLIALFKAGGDPHTLTAQEVLGDVEGRQAAKAINFGLLFGSSAATLRTSALTGFGVRMTLSKLPGIEQRSSRCIQDCWRGTTVSSTSATRRSTSPILRSQDESATRSRASMSASIPRSRWSRCTA